MEIPDARSLPPEAQEALRQRVVHAIVVRGQSITQAARTGGVHRGTASRWVNAYRRRGDGALAARARGRKPASLLTPAQEGRLLDALINQTPDQVGLPDTLWTRDAVADWAARELGVKRSRWVWGRWLKAKGFTPQRPARRAYEQDPEAVQRWLGQEYPRIEAEAKAEGAEIHWLDEAGVRSDCTAGRGYAPRRAAQASRNNTSHNRPASSWQATQGGTVTQRSQTARVRATGQRMPASRATADTSISTPSRRASARV
jgi:transposase